MNFKIMQHIFKKTFISISVLILIALLLITSLSVLSQKEALESTAVGNTYYVSKNGNNQDGRSWTTAWNELNQINWTLIRPGDVIEIDGGPASMIYNSQLTVATNGSSGLEVNIIKSQSTNHSGSPILTAGILVSGNYVTLKGLTVKKNSGDAVTVKGGDFITIDSLTIEHPGGRGIKVDGYSNPVNNITIKNTKVDTTDRINCIVPQQVDNIYLQYGNNPVLDSNTLINRGGCNIAGGPHVDIVQMYYMNNITLKNNYMEFAQGTGNDQSQASMITYFEGFLKIFNNVVRTCPNPQGGGLFAGYEARSGSSQIYIWNNTIEAQNRGIYALALTNISPTSVKAIKNNILIGSSSGSYTLFTDTPISDPSVVDYNIHDNNRYPYGVAYLDSQMSWQAWRSAGYDAHGYNIDPGLNSSLAPDSSGDPPVNKGVTIGEFSTDKTGLNRPQGSDWDIGAYEFSLQLNATPGDIDLNGSVNILDFQLLSNTFGKSVGQTGYDQRADFDNSGSITILDFQILSNNFGG